MHWRNAVSRSWGPGGNFQMMLLIAPSVLNCVAPVLRISSQNRLAEKRGITTAVAPAHRQASTE